MTQILLVGCGGFLGSVIRYLLASLLPYSTIIVNLVGSFIIGIALSLIDAKTYPTSFYFLIPGFLGGFTTFSAFSAEAVSLLEKQLYTTAFIYIFLTFTGGLILCALGMFASRLFHS